MKPTVLVFTHFYLPGTNAGGPIKSISNLVDSLGEYYFFKIITLDRDFKDKQPYKNIELNKWVSISNAQVYYISPNLFNFISIIRIIKVLRFDFYYLNSFFDPKFTFLPLILRSIGAIKNKPVLIAPRGEFSNSALKIKRWKKIPYLFFFKFFLANKNIVWQASTIMEAIDIDDKINTMSKRILRVAPDLVRSLKNILISKNIANNLSNKDILLNDNKILNICFLSRISPMKNLEFVLETLSKIKFSAVLNIHGPSENAEYLHYCEEIVGKLPSNIQVNFNGPYIQSELDGIFKNNDLFFLPTKGENFGHVIFEALSCGVPVLISDRTPWKNLEEEGAGWIGSLDDPDYFVKTITMISTLKEGELLRFKLGAYKYALNYLEKDTSFIENINLFDFMCQLK